MEPIIQTTIEKTMDAITETAAETATESTALSVADTAVSTSAEVPYDRLRRSLAYCDPRLKNSVFSIGRGARKASPGKKWTPWSRARPRVLALHLNPDGTCRPSVEYSDASLLATHFRQQAEATSDTPARSVYLLEGLARDFIGVLGEHLQIHPSVFMDHEKLAPVGDRFIREGGGLPFLPSAVHGRDHVSLKYHEPRELSSLPTDFRNICDTSGRTIAVTRLMGEFTNVGICRRKCTFWARDDASGGWTCMSSIPPFSYDQI